MKRLIEKKTARTGGRDERAQFGPLKKRSLAAKSLLFGEYALVVGISSILLGTSSLLSQTKPPHAGDPIDHAKGLREAVKAIVLDKVPSSRASKLAKFLNRLGDADLRRLKATRTAGPPPCEVQMYDENGLEVDWANKDFDSKVVKAIVIRPTPASPDDLCSFLVKDPDDSFIRTAIAE